MRQRASLSQPQEGEREAEETEPLVATDTRADVPSLQSCVTPIMVLELFTAINFVTYFDRGALAGSLSRIKVDTYIRGNGLSLSDTHSGFLVSGFMIGFMCTSPLFAALGGTVRTKFIILAGMLVWCAGCLLTAASWSYSALLLSRVLVGVGEAAFVGFTLTIIDNIAPPAKRVSWMAVFYAMIPVGTAAGMAAGGAAGDADTAARLPLSPWRLLFIGEAGAAIPILVAVAVLPARYDFTAVAHPPSAQAASAQTVEEADSLTVNASPEREDPAASAAESVQEGGGTVVSLSESHADPTYPSLLHAVGELVCNADYVLIVWGFAMYCFVAGAISVWGIPMLMQGPMGLSMRTAALVVGVCTAVCGFAGSLFGGFVADAARCRVGGEGSTTCLLFSTAMVAAAVPCGLTALFQEHLNHFLLFFIAAVLTLFALTAPINAALLSVVRRPLMPYAVSVSVFAIHFFGDFPSPSVAGMISDRLGAECQAIRDRHLCNVTAATGSGLWRKKCVWTTMDKDTSSPSRGRCINMYQVRGSLSIVFLFLALAVPCWGMAFVRLRRRSSEAVVSVPGPITAAAPLSGAAVAAHSDDAVHSSAV